jgi:dTMP kinase
MTGFFVVIDGPSGIGKTTVVQLLARRLADSGHCIVVTREPSPGPIGALARSGTQQFRGVALACLVTADRYHHIETEIRPALAAGNIVICDRYLPSSLVLQHLDGVPDELIWKLNAEIERPDLTILLDGDPSSSQGRAANRGTYSRFHGGLPGEAERYRALVDILNAANHPARSYDIGEQGADDIAEALHNIVNVWHSLNYARTDAD